MKKALSLLLSFALMWTACCPCGLTEGAAVPEFAGMNDPALPVYMEDALYDGLVTALNSDDYFVENVSAVYISQEYLDELAYNSQANIYFGYTLQELNEQFQGTRYVFTLGDNNETIVMPFEDYDDTFDRVIQNVAVGTGVILVCVTVTAVTAGAGAYPTALIFACAAKTGTTCALSGAAMGAISAGVVTGIQTGDMDAALKSAALAGSEGFKWGAISGVFSGGMEGSRMVSELKNTKMVLSVADAAKIQLESKYPLSVIKNLHSMEEYEIYKKAGLKSIKLATALDSNKMEALTRIIDLDYVDKESGLTNAQRILNGMSPLDPDGIAYELHHIGQQSTSPLAILTKKEHMQGGNNSILHIVGKASEVEHGYAWQKEVKEFWKAYLKTVRGGI